MLGLLGLGLGIAQLELTWAGADVDLYDPCSDDAVLAECGTSEEGTVCVCVRVGVCVCVDAKVGCMWY